MDLQDETLTRSKKGSPVDRLDDGDGDMDQDDAPEHPMDAKDVRERHSKLVADYRYELEVQADNRAEMAKDEDYYDNIQLTDAEIQELEDRGQAPIIYNVISTTVNWILGSEKRSRTDYKILPRGEEDAKPAEVKTKYMKYVSDVFRTPFNRSRSFEDAVKVGLGWIETSVEDEDDEEPTGDRYESWRNMLHDSASTALDNSDMRYQFRSKWMDMDIAIAMFPHCEQKIRDSATEVTSFGSSAMLDGDEAMDGAEAQRELFGGVNPIYTYKRDRVRMIEAWYKVPMKVQKIMEGPFKGDIFNEKDGRHVQEVQQNEVRLKEKTVMRVRVMLMTLTHPLYDDVSPFKHNRLKFVPIWGNRRGRDNLPYGIIRGLRGPQDGVNKRASKALHIMSSNKVMMEEGALSDTMTMDEFADEVSRPDAILMFKSGALSGNKVRVDVDRGLEAAHMDQVSRDISMIQQQGGVTDELLGRSSNAQSGVAVQKRQDQGSLATSKYFDNLRYAAQLHGEITLCNIEQFVTEKKQFRITNQRGTPEFISMNDGTPENDITRSKADFIISEADWRATMRQAAVDQLTDMIAKMPPEVGMAMLDLIVDMMDIENRDEIAKRIRAINGQKDPDQTEPTPEEQQQQAAAAEAAAAQKAMFDAELREKNAKAGKAEADTELVKGKTVEAAMSAAQMAMEASALVIQMPTIAKVADNLLMEGGWMGGQPVPTNLPANQGIPQQMAQQPPQDPGQMPPDQAAPEQMPPEMQQQMVPPEAPMQ